MAPLLQRSEAAVAARTPPILSLTPKRQTDNSTTPGDTSKGVTFSLGGILAIIFGILLALILAGFLFSMARKRRQRASPNAKSMAQANFFAKLGADQRAFESLTASERRNRDSVWGRDSFLYAAPTAGDARRKAEDDPGKVWVIKPIAPAVLPGRGVSV